MTRVDPEIRSSGIFDRGFWWSVVPRYAEVDQQGVLFNAHYLTWFDEACAAFISHLGVSYPDLMAQGRELQVAHTEVDFDEPVRWQDDVRVTVGCSHLGSTSFTLEFRVRRTDGSGHEHLAARARTVYVVVSTQTWNKHAIPTTLRSALAADVARVHVPSTGPPASRC